MSQKKTNYLNADVELEESTPAVKKKSKKKQNKTLNTVKHVLGVIGTTFLSLFMIVIITCCIVAVTLTVYIMQFADSAFDVDLKNVDLSYTSFIYAKNSAGEQVEIKRLSGDENRIWVNMEQIPKHTQDAFTAVEDKRFYEQKNCPCNNIDPVQRLRRGRLDHNTAACKEYHGRRQSNSRT